MIRNCNSHSFLTLVVQVRDKWHTPLLEQHPEHVQHLILVGAAGFSEESDRIIQFRSTWRGAIANLMWDANLTPQKIVRWCQYPSDDYFMNDLLKPHDTIWSKEWGADDMLLCRGIGPWGPSLVRKYAGVRFGTYTTGNMLNEQESKLFSGLWIPSELPWLLHVEFCP